MPLPPGEPDSAAAVTSWVRERAALGDPFASVRDASEAHRLAHGRDCTVYPSSNGPLLSVLCRAAHATRVLEIGTGLGYGALWLADGCAPAGVVDSTERDAGHRDLAREQISSHAGAQRINLLSGEARDLLPSLAAPYDVIFADADPEDYGALLEEFARLLPQGGLLISSNLFLGQYVSDMPGIDRTIAYRERLISEARLRTAFTSSGLALSVRL